MSAKNILMIIMVRSIITAVRTATNNCTHDNKHMTIRAIPTTIIMKSTYPSRQAQ